jgi:ribosomal 50S subunit-recycling heat shock protein
MRGGKPLTITRVESLTETAGLRLRSWLLALALSSLPPVMRLDLFLKLSRLCPRRTVAQQLCDAGIVLLNGRPAKSAHEVKAGDAITIRRQDRELVATVVGVPTTSNVSRRDGRELIKIISETELNPDL